MKVYVCILAVLTISLAEPPVPSNIYLPSSNYLPPSNGIKPSTQHVPSTQYGTPTGGSNIGYDEQSGAANYHFKYDVQDAESGNDFGHEEERHGDDTRGKYYVLLPDGRRQVVEYVADNEGYRPKISYEQVGGGLGHGGSGSYPGGAGGYPGGVSGNTGGYQY